MRRMKKYLFAAFHDLSIVSWAEDTVEKIFIKNIFESKMILGIVFIFCNSTKKLRSPKSLRIRMLP